MKWEAPSLAVDLIFTPVACNEANSAVKNLSTDAARLTPSVKLPLPVPVTLA